MKYRLLVHLSHSDTLVARTTLIHCLAWGFLLTLPARSWAQSAWSWRSNTAVSTQQFQGNRTATSRRADSRLQVQHRNGPFTAFTSGRYVFDHAMPAAPSWPLGTTYQLQPTLESAWLDVAPSPLLTVRLGRHDVYSHNLPARIDGVSAHIALPELEQRLTLAADFSAGWRTSGVQRVIDDDTWAAAGLPWAPDDDGRWKPRTAPTSQLVQVGFSLSYRRASRRLFAAQLGTRREFVATRDMRIGDRLLADGTVGDDRHAHVRWAFRFHQQFSTTERATIHAVVPLGAERIRVWDSGARLDRVILPLDSPFIIYDTAPSIQLWTGIRRVQRHEFSLLARRQATHGDDSPWGAGARQLVGFRAQITPETSASTRAVFGASALTANALHQQFLAWGTLTAALRRGPDLHAHGSMFVTRDTRSREQGDLVAGGWLTTGATFRATPWAHLSAFSSGGVDSRARLAARVLFTADLRLATRRP